VKLVPEGAEGEPRSIADVLDMTVHEACSFFAPYSEVLRALEPLQSVGLGYLKLGQPVPTLSGGEAQRLKLAGHLARALKKGRSPDHALFLFDEPTTGLHFEDIAVLLRAFRNLIRTGHSIIVIEHNLDVIAASDWIVDLGPEGGEAGGSVVCTGTPEKVAAHGTSHTGQALQACLSPGGPAGRKEAPRVREPAARVVSSNGHIVIRHAREHNLKGVSVRIPRDRFTVVTGVSGSGKSTLAFDILFSEGQRRYLESLNAYARQFVQPASRPDVDSVTGVPPTVAIEQRSSRGGRKSTVATMTEIYHFLRLLFARLGTQHCPACGVPIEPQTVEAIHERILDDFQGMRVGIYAPLVTARKGYYTDLAAWAAGKGFSRLRVDGVLVSTRNWPRLSRYREHSIELPVGAAEIDPAASEELRRLLERGLQFGEGVVYVVDEAASGSTVRDSETAKPPGPGPRIFSTIRSCPSCGRSFEELDPRLFSFNSKHGWCPTCAGTGLLAATGEELEDTYTAAEGEDLLPCPSCGGTRLRPEALAVTFRDRTIAEYTALSVLEASSFFGKLALSERERDIAKDVIQELVSRLSFLDEVGLSYLSLDRAAPTLSGGEAQRIRLASQLGSNLRGVCYILDEPTIGLHVRDNRMLLDTLGRLRDKGNTVVVVEHDEETIRRSEYVIDLGPGGGVHGGEVVDEGTVKELLKSTHSVTGRFLRDPLRHPLMPRKRAETPEHRLVLVDVSLHNLENLRVEIPLGRLVCITGVSGSGKSTLGRDVLFRSLRGLHRADHSHGAAQPGALSGCARLEGWEQVGRVLEVDQTPIGKTPRSCPATYVGFWDGIRKIFAQLPESRMRGYGSARFSFNVSGGRCDACAGQGVKRIQMSFLPNVSVLCELCGGKRFNPETLSIRFKEKSIADVLEMSVEEAVDFFQAHPSIYHPLRLMEEIGLGYLHLGQQSPTLSGGEAQRIKLVTELAKVKPNLRGRRAKANGHTLYVLDEPTIGLHMADVEKLIRVLHRLVDAGNTVVIIEHNLDVIAEADWIIDLGPEGGNEGGRIVAEGPPERIILNGSGSHTARILAEFLESRRAAGS
jgi:excinuclease ABC subunit A